jgi:hypothetical protein
VGGVDDPNMRGEGVLTGGLTPTAVTPAAFLISLCIRLFSLCIRL